MIIVDTNVLIDYLNNPTDKQTEIFRQNDIVTCGVINTELLRGAKNPQEKQSISLVLDSLGYLPFEESDWRELADLFYKLKINGLSVPFQDGIIAYLSLKHKCELWTNDKHFKMIQGVFSNLKLFTSGR